MTVSQQTKEKTEYNQQEITIWAPKIKRVFTESQWDWLFHSPTTSSLLCVLFQPVQVTVLCATVVIHYMCFLKVILKKALKNQYIMKQPPNSSEGQ